MDESLFIFVLVCEGVFIFCKKSDIFCVIDKGVVRLFDSCL